MLGVTMANGADLSAVRTLDELVDELRAYRIAQPHQEWLQGWGLDPNAFGRQPITSVPIVAAVGDIPALLILFDGHSVIATPAALHLAGIRGAMRFDGAAAVVCDEGRPTGHLLEIPAYDLVRNVMPQPSVAEAQSRLQALLAAMAATGLTAGNAMDFDGRADEVMASLPGDTPLPLRLRFAPMCMPGSKREFLDHVIDLQRMRGDRWQVEGAKFMIDGTIDAGTAWLDHPDCHGESTAPFWPDPDEYIDCVRYLAAAGVPTVTHAIGDAGVRYVLDALSGIPARATETSPRQVPHRIEHIETIPDELLPRFRHLDVTASMQPTHCTLYTRADHSDNWSTRLGADRADQGFRIRDLREAGARVALGSDWPVAPYDPRGIIADAQLRRRHGHPDDAPIGGQQKLTALMALEGYTTHAAAAAGLSSVAGMIAPGRRADLSAFALDPVQVPPDEFAESVVPLTVVAAEVAHRSHD
ncbi:amidohydrolase [Mycobacterium montefiorense]|uniref:Amidohydrolase n=2 Tax=Mycobacterium montefiorense TaxID=154654 RepID=A0AA37UXA6_9MYCO|nr:amidohydrolase family protein [Mycobacterium montefiorense]GBG39598.1 amidohydrolase [Mycobacterium montefiorense]GKU34693.1 amidohydrolase [Mycobacterium montefiorense]GKU42441.1 amidohydrolase [Mycobacterium montefiorense]GKU45980.1 amidohydrolase [Mycobacterium montefiorense]GKU52069.1 amidohydrolase [Mycobacterium montefiorense]